ncbi:MAG: PAS domain S-box protein [Rhodospirillaceae bacterium]|nr:PAS domain S-box protein [Rhodospirillaceae bacterium]
MTAPSAIKTSAPDRSDFAQLTVQTWLEALPSPAVVLDGDMVLVAANGRAEDMLQSYPASVVGAIVNGPFRSIADRVRRIAGIETQAWFEHPLGGTWYYVTAYPVQARADGPVLQVVIATDITRQKHAEFEIRESEARLEEATRIAQLGTYKVYWDTEAVQWSPHMYVLHGLSPDSFVHTPDSYREIVHPEDRDLHERYRRNQLEGKALHGAEYRIIRKDGTMRWLRLDGRVLFDADGEPYASFGTCQDVTEGKQREQELKHLLRRNTILYEALDASPIGVAVLTTDGPRPEVFYVNAEFERLTGHKASSLAKRSIGALRAEDQSGVAGGEWDKVNLALQTSRAGAFELTCVRRDGTTFLGQLEVAPVRDHPGREATVFVLNLRDITIDRQRAEQLLQSQKMEALGQLSGGVAHEINNLLQPVLALSDLGQDIADTDPVKVRKYFEVIASSGRKARDVVRQVLTFARRDAPQLAAYPITALVEDALRLLQSGLPPEIKLMQQIEAGEAEALVNPTQVSQVVLNLVKNAADAMDGKGTVSVRLRSIDLDAAPAGALALAPGRWIELQVADAGCGMDAYTLSRVFEPFFTTKLAGKGTGLGLSVVYSIVVGWGGMLKLESEVDQGTTAMVYIPAAHSDAS